MPEFNETIEDITNVQNHRNYSWDVTDIVYGWYKDASNSLLNNTGMMFKASNTVESSNQNNWQQFCSSDFDFSTDVSVAGAARPCLTITFIEADGLEQYWVIPRFQRGGPEPAMSITHQVIWCGYTVTWALTVTGCRLLLSMSIIPAPHGTVKVLQAITPMAWAMAGNQITTKR